MKEVAGWTKRITSNKSSNVKYIYSQGMLKGRTERIKYSFQKLQRTGFIGSNVTLIEIIVKREKSKALFL